MNLWKNKINNNRFGGKTKKFKNNKGEWEYKTEIRNENNELIAVINENYMIIYDTNKNYCKYWTKRTTNENDAITFEIFLTKDNELYKYVKEYKNINELTNEIENNQVLNSPSIRSKLSKILGTTYSNFLEQNTIKCINNIDTLINNITLFNQELDDINNINSKTLLKLYNYLTHLQKLIDSPSSNIWTNPKIKEILPNLLLTLLLVYLAFTGKNAQRIISTYIFDENEYKLKDYFYGILWNKQNYITTIIDTFLTTFFTSEIANWSRSTIWNIVKNKKNNIENDIKIKKIPIEPFKNYKHEFLTLLCEENNVKLKSNIEKIIRINNLIKKLNNIEKTTDFEYHPNFTKEIEKINSFNHLNKPIEKTVIKESISSSNKVIDNELVKKSRQLR